MKAEAVLSPFSKLSLRSHVRMKHRVLLFSHQPVRVPDGIELVDADEHMSAEAAWGALERGHKIFQIADFVRMSAVASMPDSVLMDVDHVVLNNIPDDPCFISSLPAKRTGGMAIKWGDRFPPLKVPDKSWDGKGLSSWPMRVGAAQKYAEELSRNISEVLNGPLIQSKMDSLYIMRGIRVFQKIESCMAFPPLKFSPVPSWSFRNRCLSLESPTRFDGKTELFGYALPSIETILEKSSTVAHWFESAVGASDIAGEGFWDSIPDGCLVDHECRKVIGPEWREELCSLKRIKASKNRIKRFGLLNASS